jgi:hypothetical protein
MQVRRLFLVAIIVSGVSQLFGQSVETLTINQAVDEALKNNLNLIAQKLDVSMAEAQVATARLRPGFVRDFATGCERRAMREARPRSTHW